MTNEQIAKKYAEKIQARVDKKTEEYESMFINVEVSTRRFIQQAIGEATAGDDALVKALREIADRKAGQGLCPTTLRPSAATARAFRGGFRTATEECAEIALQALQQRGK